MAGEGKEEDVAAAVGYVDPLFLSGADNPQMLLSNMLFDGGNFPKWSRNVRMSLGAKNKLVYINGSCTKPEVGTKESSKWLRNDYMIRRWLLESMTVEMAQCLMLMESSKQLWDEVVERYGQSNAPQLYQLRIDVAKLEEEKMSVSEYYYKLRRYKDEIQAVESLPTCDCGVMSKCTCKLHKKLMEMIERHRLIDFLIGLNMEYDNM